MPVSDKFTFLSAISLCLMAPLFASADAHAQTETPLCPPASEGLSFDVAAQADALAEGVIKVSSKTADIQNEQQADFSGDVVIQRNNQWLLTQQARINQQKSTINAQGGVRFTDGYINVTGASFNFDGSSETARLQKTEYEMASTKARGEAQQLEISPSHISLLSSSFTTCPADSPAWQLKAERIEIDETSDFGKAWGAKLELFDVPVFYLPYFTFPLNEKRKSGLLYTTID